MTYQEMIKEAEKVGGVKLLSPTFHEWKKEGETIVGKLLAKAEVTSSISTGSYFQYLVDTDEGPVKFHMGRATDNEIGALLVTGGVYSFTYKGSEKISGGRTVNKFEINAIDTDALSDTQKEEDIPF